MCPLQQQYDLDPFPPPELLGFIGTMGPLTPYCSSQFPCLLGL